MIKVEKEKILSEFGEEQGKIIIAETEGIEEHCKANNIKHHSINADGSCNMGCC